jgi:hypothetical protein
MPIARYFVVVGSVLLSLLLIAGWSLPEPSASFPDHPGVVERAAIRIKSAHKWPEKIVLDASPPTIPPSAVEEPPATLSVWLLPDELEGRSTLEAMAQVKPDTQPAAADHPTFQIKRGVARTVRSRHVARAPVTRRLARAEAGRDCCQLGWIDNGQTSSDAISRRHAASSWPMY